MVNFKQNHFYNHPTLRKQKKRFLLIHSTFKLTSVLGLDHFASNKNLLLWEKWIVLAVDLPGSQIATLIWEKCDEKRCLMRAENMN